MPAIRYIFFDLDGTLIDTAPDLTAALNHSLALHTNRPPISIDEIKAFVSDGASGMINHVFSKDGGNHVLDTALLDQIRKDMLKYYADHIADKSRLFPGIAELLNRLDERHISWGIITNKPERFALPLMEKLQLHQRAACIVCGDTATHSKPHPAPLFYAFEKLSCQPDQALFIGDAKNDIAAGKNAHTTTLLAAYGYLPADHSHSTWGADGTIEHPQEILPWIERYNQRHNSQNNSASVALA